MHAQRSTSCSSDVNQTTFRTEQTGEILPGSQGCLQGGQLISSWCHVNSLWTGAANFVGVGGVMQQNRRRFRRRLVYRRPSSLRLMCPSAEISAFFFFLSFKGLWCCHQGFHLITERHQREMKRSTDSPFVPPGGTRLQSRCACLGSLSFDFSCAGSLRAREKVISPGRNSVPASVTEAAGRQEKIREPDQTSSPSEDHRKTGGWTLVSFQICCIAHKSP